ncbi:MAG: hypothetical protein M3O36_15195 [Myxococcota bacterium]|nr:hypothetical protein [Myxococcota bacterium]
MQERETCVDCGARSPEKNEDHTLTSSMGWRLTRERLQDGSFRAAWRCRDCFEKHKAAKQSARDRKLAGRSE